MNLVNCGLYRSSGKMKQYGDLGCGTDIPLENCLFFQYKLKQSPNDKSWQNLMDVNKCKDILNANLTSTVKAVMNTYSEYDKNRIETESKYQRNKKIFIGAMVFLTVVGIFLVRKK